MATQAQPSGWWRKQALSSWSDTRDPQFYGTFEVDAEAAQRALAAASAHYGRRIALQHLVLKAVAATVADHPEMNRTVRWGRAVPHVGLPLAQLTYVPDEAAGAQGPGILSTLPCSPEAVAACLLPSPRAPFLLTLTPPRPRPVVRDGAVVIRPILRLFGTFDNRLVDGYAACRFGDALARWL